ncbi:MAG: M15 family metallopeptidase [Clostridiales bacterium]|nr:M15 family metallopeptidase [Clostridiales bacterium]
MKHTVCAALVRSFSAVCLLALLAGCGAPAASGGSSAAAEQSSGLLPEAGSAASSEVQPEVVSEAAGAGSAEASSDLEPEVQALTEEDVLDMAAGTVLTAEEMSGLDVDLLFTESALTDEVFARMEGVSYPEGCTVSRDDLRYLRVLHIGFDGEVHIGEMVCNKRISGDLLEIFRGLYDAAYPIEKMLLIDEYGGDDEASMTDNNTSCFNYRVVSGSDHLSAHAYGLAVDVNPLYNPYVTSAGYFPANAGDYVDRSADTPYKIDESDLCYQLFTDHGFFWGGNWSSVKDYQHFVMED